MLIPMRLSAQSDEQLMKRASQGNERAFEELYNRHARRLQGFFTRRLGNDADLAEGTLDSLADNEDIEIDIDADILHDALHNVLKSLPEHLALLFSLHYEEELTVPQIAQIMQLPEGTVKSRLHKAMTTIKTKLKQYED